MHVGFDTNFHIFPVLSLQVIIRYFVVFCKVYIYLVHHVGRSKIEQKLTLFGESIQEIAHDEI